MAEVVVVGSVARDEVVRMNEPLRGGTHLAGEWRGARLGGGAACTAVPLAHAGHGVTVVGALGRDMIGEALLAELEVTGVDTTRIVRLHQPSTRSIIMVEESGERTIVNVTRTKEAGPPTRLMELPADCVYVRSRATDLADLLAEKAQESLVIAHIPPSGAGDRPAHILVGSASDLTPDIIADPLAAGRQIAGDLLQWVLITRGPDGVIAFSEARTIETPAPEVTPNDTTGAGDSFSAGLVHALVSGAEMEQALAVACAWGAEATMWDRSILPREAVRRLIAETEADPTRPYGAAGPHDLETHQPLSA